METNENDIIRKRYPHAPPDRSEYDTEEGYQSARLRFCESQAELTTWIFETLPYPVVFTLHDGTIAFANVHAQQLLGLTREDVSRHTALEFLYDADGRSIGESVGRRLAAHEMIRQEAVYVLRPDGRRELRILTVTPIQVPGFQTIVRAVGIFQDPTTCERELESLRVLNEQLAKAFNALKEDVERFRILAYTDDMTGVANRRAFWEGFRDAVGEARRERGSIALFYFDPDGFKEKNDTYGHREGDNLVRAVAGRLRSVADAFDGTIARLGGDEFCVYFRGVNAARYAEIANAFAEVTRFEFEARRKGTREKETFLMTVSFGGSLQVDGIIPEPGELYDEADDAMFECKESGKGESKFLPYVLRYPHIHSSAPPKP
ncbi:diguanylate cyclase [Candidatus Uhrbacteria bacterium]|nr:MAG: diguanylate cyclase [Candidatus Uhrbacteria bacterium]